MPERIYKLQPNRTMQLRGFDHLGAAAALHSTSASSFKVSGIFRDAADFAVLILYDADNFYEHPLLKYLPDFDFTGLVLTFDLAYGTGLQPIDSPKYNWIDWASLDCVREDGSTANVRLWDYAALQAGSFSVASGTFDFETGPDGPQPFDRVSLWFQNLAYDFIVPAGASEVEYQFFAAGTGRVHNITVNGRNYSHTESDPNGESSAGQALALVNAINAGDGDAQVSAAIGSVSHAVRLSVRPSALGQSIPVSASDSNVPTTLSSTTLAAVIADLRDQINSTDWIAANASFSLRASSTDTAITIRASRYGTVDANGPTVTWVSGARFTGLAAGSVVTIAGTNYLIAEVNGPGQLTLTGSAGTQRGAPFVAERGGYDGNMIEMYSLSKTATLKCTQSSVRFNGGSSDVTWRCSIDFSARGINRLRQCWLTFAPPLANGSAFADTAWEAAFTNWNLAGPEETRALKVAGPGSVRVEESDSWCTYTGNWTLKSGFFSNSFAKAASAAGDSVEVFYSCQYPHDVYIGTSLYTDNGSAAVRLDGDAETDLNCYLQSEPPVNTRRKVRAAVPAGKHTVKLTVKSGIFYFDFLEAAVPSDVPDPLPARVNISPALDYSTDHTYKLPPARILWNFDQLGFAGPMNEYIGVFWWNQRARRGGVIPKKVITFSGAWAGGDSVFLMIGDFNIGKSVFPADTPETIAAHFARYINGLFVGIWASAEANVLTITYRSASYAFVIEISQSSARGVVSSPGSVEVGDPGTWEVDVSQSPALNRGAQAWHKDLYEQCQARGCEIITAVSMELVFPPAGFAAQYSDGTPVTTDVGFGALRSTHCAQSSPMLNYHKAVYEGIADLQAAAGLKPRLQFGEHLWWFFEKAGVGMAYYDAETKAAGAAALGRPLHVFTGPDDDPGVNAGADAIFLRNRLRDHVAALVAHVRSLHPNAVFELLFPYDVNHPTPVQNILYDPPYWLGGRLNRFVNLPTEWEQKQTSGFDLLKLEALGFGANFRSLDLAKTAIRFPLELGWPRDSVRYLVPVFGHACPWEKEYLVAKGSGIPIINLWAFDQVSIFGLNVKEPRSARRAARF